MCLGALGALAASHGPGPAAAEGRYERRRAHRGEQTATSAKLGTYAFIDDREAPPRRLAAFVDAAGFRERLPPELVPVRVGLAYRGKGRPVPLRPSRFLLSGGSLPAPLRALTQDELLADPRGRQALAHARLALAARASPQAFGEADGLRIPTLFHSDPRDGVGLNDDTSLPPGAWFTDVLFFRLPRGFEPEGQLLRLSFEAPPAGGGEGLEEAVSVRFRVEEDAQLNRRAFRRARKARRQEDKAAARAARRAERLEGSEGGGPPPR